MIIDSHTHVDEAPSFGWYDPPETIVRLLDEAQIDRAIVMTYRDAPGPEERVLEYLAEAVQRYPDRLIGYARMNPRYGDKAAELFDRAVRDYGMRGLKLHPVGYVMSPPEPRRRRAARSRPRSGRARRSRRPRSRSGPSARARARR